MTTQRMNGTTEVTFEDLYAVRDAVSKALTEDDTAGLYQALKRLDWYLKPVGDAV